jgi:hypothetical protein
MTGLRLLIALSLLVMSPIFSAAQEAPTNLEVSESESKREMSAAMTRRIDELIRAQWQDAAVEPAAQADDAEFMRRVYLDLTGVVPSVFETRVFLKGETADK